jgi:putative transposase
MANTYTQISIQAVFAVKGRHNFIVRTWRDSFHEYVLEFFVRRQPHLQSVDGKIMFIFFLVYHLWCAFQI